MQVSGRWRPHPIGQEPPVEASIQFAWPRSRPSPRNGRFPASKLTAVLPQGGHKRSSAVSRNRSTISAIAGRVWTATEPTYTSLKSSGHESSPSAMKSSCTKPSIAFETASQNQKASRPSRNPTARCRAITYTRPASLCRQPRSSAPCQ
jgi:hypothetical protein